jgi:choline dehydrogenase-like flavoprotein
MPTMKPHETRFDVCVIGTGAGGGVMIDQLTAAGFEVVALERGGHVGPVDFDDDELRNVVRDQVFSPHQLETYRFEDGAPSETGRFSHLAHCVGGTITHWAAWSWRFREDDFYVLSKEGAVEGASLADWPIRYADLEPFYEKAERDFGVAGAADSNPFAPPRQSAYPNPRHPERVSAKHFAKGASKLGYHPFPVPMAINSRGYGGRPRCMYGGACRSYGCPVHAKATTLSVSLPRATATGRLDLRAEAMVYELPIDAEGRVTGARYVDASGRQHEVRARHTVVACGSIGTPQLLLMSTSGSFPQGLANGSGLVGRNLTFHHHPAVTAILDDDLRAYTGFETHAALDDLHASDPKRGFIRGGVIAELNTFTHQPIAYATVLGDALGFGARWGPGLKDRIRAFPNTLVIALIGEELPMESSRVDLDPEVKDRFGLPVPRITKHHHPNDLAMYDWYEKRLLELAEATGARSVAPGRVDGLTIGPDRAQKGNAHNHGTARMGNDPSKSVIDRHCRSHEVPNLWIVDGSFMPTSAGYNPTLTILANAYRVADHFIEQARRQSL